MRVGLKILTASILGVSAMSSASPSIAASSAPTSATASVTETYTAAQADAGKSVIATKCAQCHDANLAASAIIPLSGPDFLAKWSGRSVYDLVQVMRSTMPATAPGSLPDEEYLAVTAFILQKNGIAPSARPMTGNNKVLKAITWPSPVGGLVKAPEPEIVIPPAPGAVANPLNKFAPVSEAMLTNPADGDWLAWRRANSGLGYSPLKQINASNVGNLAVAWSWPLPAGANHSTPLVHDGVLFVLGAGGNNVQALNAATGDLLWQYSESRGAGEPDKTGGQGILKKGMALFKDRLYVPTADSHMIALNAKTGEIVWDVPISGDMTPALIVGGPLIAKNKVIVGVSSTPPISGAGYVLALDADTGAESWRFRTVAKPGDPGGETWNDLPINKRTGGSLWTLGSYDSETGLVYFGTGNTYNTVPLREPRNGKGSNDALYTNSTLAIDPDSGKLAWYYQHMPSDQWDLDWTFERPILTMRVNGTPTKVVVATGKVGISDVLDAKTGKYLFSLDAGLQNLIVGIDPQTGAKTYNPEATPHDKKTMFVCPHVSGVRNWPPLSINPQTKIMVTPLYEVCMYMTPDRESPLGGRIVMAPVKDSDGLFGRLQAVNLETKKVVWASRQRAPYSSGVLATAGGLIFAGSVDRVLSAHDEATGKKLWSAKLNEVMNSSPISYSVNGKQYVAAVLGFGGQRSVRVMTFLPEERLSSRNSTLWVFALPDAKHN